MKRFLGVLACATASMLAACNNGGTNAIVTVPVCGLQGNTAMIYPIPGRTAPASTQVIYIASNNSTLGNGQFNAWVQPPNGLPAYPGGNFVSVPASSVPKPHARVTSANPYVYASNIGGLSAGSTYTIGFNVITQTCTPNGIGSFTTQ